MDEQVFYLKLFPYPLCNKPRVSRCLNSCSKRLFVFFSLDIDEMSVTPTGNQIIDLGKQVKWQCKTKASKNHTVLWKKVH